MPSRANKNCRAFDRLEKKVQRKPSRMSGKRGAMHPDHAEFFAALGRRIRELRKERGWSLHKMVTDHGYYLAQWQKYEKGGPVTVDSLLRMSTMFGLSLGELIDSLGEFPSLERAEEKIPPFAKSAAQAPAVKTAVKAGPKNIAAKTK